MKKIFTFLIVIMISVAALFAQSPEKFSYQAVVRNAGNALVTDHTVSARISVLQGGVNGAPVYVETHTATTNMNGLLTIEVGGGTMVSGSLETVNWAEGPFFLKSEIDPDGGINYSIEGTQQLLSVPYALYAKEAANSFSGDYNDLTNTPQIPTVPTNVSAFTNDAGYITNNDIPAIPTVPTNVSAFTNDAGYITGYTETDPLFTAWDKDYNDLTNKPTIPTVPTNVSAFTNDAGYITSYTETDPLFAAWDKNYNDLTNRPVIPTVPDSVSAFVNDAGYLTSYTEQQELSISNDSIFLTGGSFVKLPAAAVGFSGDYNDLINKPVIPAVPDSVSAFVNDAGYLTSYTETDPLFTAWDKDYNDLTNKPTIPTVPTNVSAFTNDAGYITMDSIPAFPTIPTNVSVFENDAHYITDVQLQQIMSTIATMQNTIDSMGLVIEALYNQINQPDSTQEMTDTSLQVTFTTVGYNHAPAVHQPDLQLTTYYKNYASANGLTQPLDDWWIFESNRLPEMRFTAVYTNKPVTGFTVLKYRSDQDRWFTSTYDNSHFSFDENDPTHKTVIFEYYNEDDESWEYERSLYAIKFEVEE